MRIRAPQRFEPQRTQEGCHLQQRALRASAEHLDSGRSFSIHLPLFSALKATATQTSYIIEAALRNTPRDGVRPPVEQGRCYFGLPLTVAHPRWGQALVFRHSGAMRSRSTGRPPTRCSSTMAGASAGRTLPYQTASGYTTTKGPCSHWSRHPDLLMRTRGPSPAALVNCCSWVCRSLVPAAVQDGRGASAGRVLWQTKTCRSKAGKRCSSSSRLLSD